VAVSDMAEAVEAAGVPPEAPPELAEDPGGVAGDGAPAAAGGEANVSEAELDRIEAEENGVFRVSSAELEKSVAGGRRPHHDLDIITESEAVGSGEEGGDGAERDFGHMGAEKAGTDERGRTVSKRRGSLADRLNPNNLLHAAASPEAGGARGKGNKKPSRKMIAPAEPTTVERQGMAKRSPLAAARFGELDLLSTHAVDGKLELRDALHFSPLHFAACYGHAEATSLILRSGVDPDPVSVQGWTPLHLASRNGHAGCVKSLLQHKADVTLVDEWKATALHNGCASGNSDVVELLIHARAPPNAQDVDGWGPLHFAARTNNVDACVLLLRNGAEPNLADADGWTPAHNSARNGRNRCVQVLIEHQADICATTRMAETPLHIACRKGKSRVVSILVNSAERQNILNKVLQMRDKDRLTAEEIPSSDFIRSILAGNPSRTGADTYTKAPTDGSADRHSSGGSGMLGPMMPAPGAEQKKSGACTIL